MLPDQKANEIVLKHIKQIDSYGEAKKTAVCECDGIIAVLDDCLNLLVPQENKLARKNIALLRKKYVIVKSKIIRNL